VPFVANLFPEDMLAAQTKPQITISPERAQSGDLVYLMGKGFTPNNTVMSHLLRPDGTEYNPLRLLTDVRGEFTRKIDTTMLQTGTFESWVEDEASKTVSNHTKFKVE
jgi:hypothetical protein